MNEIYIGTPFKDPLVRIRREDNSSISHLYLPKERPNYLVRVLPWCGFQTLEKIEMGKSLFTELERNYNIGVPRHDVIIGPWPRDDRGAVYTAVERIEGVRLSEARVDNKTAESFCSFLLAYFSDKYEANGYFLADLHPFQFLYGTRKGDAQKRIFLVDIDPSFEELKKEDPEYIGNGYFFTNLYGLYYIISSL